jgi:hypothetical protein
MDESEIAVSENKTPTTRGSGGFSLGSAIVSICSVVAAAVPPESFPHTAGYKTLEHCLTGEFQVETRKRQ